MQKLKRAHADFSYRRVLQAALLLLLVVSEGAML
jgi:hypothetical protein